jgi:tetratricopeptide (TPR) repeat protein
MIREHNEPAGESKDFGPREVMQRMERLLSETKPAAKKGKARARGEAQQLVYDAWEAPTDEDEHALMSRALELDPANTDALLYMLDRGGLKPEEEIQALRQIVASAADSLGPKIFKQNAGHFWGCIETRPYMRARQRLAVALEAAGRSEEAIAEYEAILELNPNDNQGVRLVLLPAYLGLNRLEPARALLQKYPEVGWSAVFSWCLVLERWLSGDLPAAAKALAFARKQNPHMQAYVKGHRKVPRDVPPAYAPGSKDEAICLADVLRAAWSRHPRALDWLAAQKIQ